MGQKSPTSSQILRKKASGLPLRMPLCYESRDDPALSAPSRRMLACDLTFTINHGPNQSCSAEDDKSPGQAWTLQASNRQEKCRCD